MRRGVCGALIAIPALPWLYEACLRASWAPLGRDQGIFQYVAWAVTKGQTAYRDVRDVNGPLIYLLHHVMLLLGGASEHRFRTLDLLFVGITAAIFGAMLPSIGRRQPSVTARLSGAAAATTVILAQYLGYGFWDMAQRESFCDGFVLVSLGLQVEGCARKKSWLLAAAGAMSITPWLGKPTYALYTVVQIGALLWDDTAVPRWRRISLFALGGVAGALVPLLWLLRFGDAPAWFRITFFEIPAMYRFIWPRPPMVIIELFRNAVLLACLTNVPMLALVLLEKMPRRALPIASFALVGLVSVLVQAKGFPYHFHPVTLGSTIAMLAMVWWAFDTAKSPSTRAGVALLALGLAGRAALEARHAPFLVSPILRDDASLSSSNRLAPYTRVDFFPGAMHRVAELVEAQTNTTDTVQVYGMDPYLLFLAHRLSATPYILAYELDDYWALVGAYDPGGTVKPDEAQKSRIRSMRDAHEADMLARLDAAPPAAFVFVSRSPLMSHEDALDDFADHCPDTTAWMLRRYHEVSCEEGIRVFFRSEPRLDIVP